MLHKIAILSILILTLLLSCIKVSKRQNLESEEIVSKPEKDKIYYSIEYQSDNLIVRKISENVYQHISFLNTESFGKVPCNGMIVINNKEAVIFDTPTTNENSQELINFLTKKANYTIKAIIPTHYHSDCLGGLETFHANNIPSYACNQTIEFAKKNESILPQNSFKTQLELPVGNKKVYAKFFGEGHTADNIIGYYPNDEILFGGCLIKQLGAKKGNLADANTSKWSKTVQKVKIKYPQIKTVIPGHGEPGGIDLFDYTIRLFE